MDGLVMVGGTEHEVEEGEREDAEDAEEDGGKEHEGEDDEEEVGGKRGGGGAGQGEETTRVRAREGEETTRAREGVGSVFLLSVCRWNEAMCSSGQRRYFPPLLVF
eukprot:GHVU01033302.1.p3 GENE.GHVU01033302.1~~GHVU01033302.1.p3  ORF type:complete len:106 (+),score=31.90 GHVU01033302.1:338-655(+)